MGERAFPISEIQSPGPEARFLVKNIPPPSPLYIGLENFITIQAWSGVGGVEVEIRGRLLRMDGVIIPFAERMTPLGNYSTTTRTIRLAEGYLLDVGARLTTGSQPKGVMFVRAVLNHGSATSGVEVAQLFSDYVSSIFAPTWPNSTPRHSVDERGRIRVIVGTDPGAGAEILESVPGNTVWRLLSLTATLVTGVAAGKRAQLLIDDTVNTYVRLTDTLVQGAAETVVYSWTTWGAPSVNVATFACTRSLPQEMRLNEGHRIRTLTQNLAADDNWSAPIFMVEEWIEGV